MLLPVLIGILVLFALIIIIGALRPPAFRITRSALIKAPAPIVFAQVNDLHKWQAWSPWAKLDPNSKIIYSGPVAGVGASFTWDGNKKVGSGRLTITESRAHDLIRFKLEFLKPFPGTNAVEFTFKPEGAQTAVTWDMTGNYHLVPRIMKTFINLDKMIGAQFEQGLADLDRIARLSV